MTQEDRQLLLKDLCARLPYGVKINIRNDYTLTMEDMEFNAYHLATASYDFEYRNLRPYLRPMSSMTEEEKDELCKRCDFEKSYDDRDYFTHYGIEVISEYCVDGKKIPESFINYSVIDFFYERHLDFRGLIPMGLALEATEDMYKTE